MSIDPTGPQTNNCSWWGLISLGFGGVASRQQFLGFITDKHCCIRLDLPKTDDFNVRWLPVSRRLRIPKVFTWLVSNHASVVQDL